MKLATVNAMNGSPRPNELVDTVRDVAKFFIENAGAELEGNPAGLRGRVGSVFRGEPRAAVETD